MKKGLLLFLTGLTAASLLTGCGESSKLRMGTGNIQGRYYAYGNTLQETLSSSNCDFTLDVKETAGSAANLRLMKEGFLDISIVQSDILSDAVHGTGSFTDNAYTNAVTIAPLYMEQCQIVVPADSSIQSLNDLTGKRVSIGEAESGVSVIAKLLLQAAGMKENAIDAKYLSFSDSATSLEQGTIDAFFIVAGAPTAAIEELSEKMSIRLLPLDERTLSYMTNLYDGYVQTTVPAGTYVGVPDETATIGVQAILVADSKVPEKKIQKIKEIIDANHSF